MLTMENNNQIPVHAQQREAHSVPLIANHVPASSDHRVVPPTSDAADDAADTAFILATSSESQSNQILSTSQRLDDDKSNDDDALPVLDRLVTRLPLSVPSVQDNSPKQHSSSMPMIDSTLLDVQPRRE